MRNQCCTCHKLETLWCVKIILDFLSIFSFNFVLLDSTYTERYMGLPNLTDNYQGYNEGDLTKHVDQLKDKQFLLVS